MANYIYDINTYLEGVSALTTLIGAGWRARPLVAFEDDAAPIICYSYRPGIKSDNQYWWKIYNIDYSVFDTDADRCFNIGEAIIDALNQGDDIQQVIGSNNFIGKGSFLVNGDMDGPSQRDGWYKYSIRLRVSYVPVS